jgi:transposase, IS5 family
MAGLAILKHTYDLSDEALCDRWVENPYFQYFCGEEFFQHALVFDRSSLSRWRQRVGQRSSRRCCRKAWRSRPGRTR